MKMAGAPDFSYFPSKQYSNGGGLDFHGSCHGRGEESVTGGCSGPMPGPPPSVVLPSRPATIRIEYWWAVTVLRTQKKMLQGARKIQMSIWTRDFRINSSQLIMVPQVEPVR